MVDFPTGVAATDPTDLVGANATDPAKLTITALGRSLITATTSAEQRAVLQSMPDSSVQYSHTEMFLNGTSGIGQGISSTVSGGSTSAVTVTGRNGVLRAVTGTAAVADQRVLLGSSLVSTISLGSGIIEFTFEGAPTIAIFNGTNTGRIDIGLHDAPSSSVEPVDGVYFRTINGGNYFAVCRSNNVETAVDSGIAPALDTFLFFQVIVNANATSADLNLYNASGTQIFTTTITTNIPTGAGRQVGHGTRIVRSSATAVDHGLLHDTFFFNYIFPSPLPF